MVIAYQLKRKAKGKIFRSVFDTKVQYMKAKKKYRRTIIK